MKNSKKEFSYRESFAICVFLMAVMTVIMLSVTLQDIISACSDSRESETAECELSTPRKHAEIENISYCCPMDDNVQDQTVSLGIFKVTAYCGCETCCGKWGKDRPVDAEGNTIVYTAYGDIAREGVTVAADPSVFPRGTEIIIDGRTYTVQDKGGAIKEKCIDIYFESHEDAREWGVKYIEVFVTRNLTER